MKIFHMGVWSVAVAVLWISAALAAEETKKETVNLEDIVVQGTKDKERVPVYVDNVIVEDEIERTSIVNSVVQALCNQAGIQTRSSSLAGVQRSRVRLRGFDETRYRVLIDGAPFQRDGSYGNGPVNWSMLTTENVEQIEIIRGAGPAQFGNSIGGTINIQTKKPSKTPDTRVSATYGSLATWDTRASHRWRYGPLGWDFSASHYETNGYLRNNDFDRNNFSGNLSLDLPYEFEIGGGIMYSGSETGMPVYNFPDSPFYDPDNPRALERELGGPGVSRYLIDGLYGWGNDSKVDDESTMITAYVAKHFEIGKAKLTYMLWNMSRDEYFYDSKTKDLIYKRHTKAEDDNWQILGESTFDVGRHTIGLGGEMRSYGWGDQTVPFIDKSKFTPAINYFTFIQDGFKGQPSCLRYYGAYAQDLWRVHPDVELMGGLRAEWFHASEIDPAAFGFPASTQSATMRDNSLDPRLSAIWRPWKGGSLTGRFNIVHRYPSSPEYFWWYLNNGTDFFNTTLKPERSVQYEFEIGQEVFGVANGLVRLYHYDVDHYISTVVVPGTGSVVYNIDDVTVKGLELEMGVHLPFNFYLWGNLTLQDSDKDGDPWDSGNAATNQLPDFPARMFNVGIDYTLDETLKTQLYLNYVGSREHFLGQKLVKPDAYTLLNFAATYRIWQNSWSKWEVLFSAENILGEDYEEEAGYPMPGRTFVGGIRLLF